MFSEKFDRPNSVIQQAVDAVRQKFGQEMGGLVMAVAMSAYFEGMMDANTLVASGIDAAGGDIPCERIKKMTQNANAKVEKMRDGIVPPAKIREFIQGLNGNSTIH